MKHTEYRVFWAWESDREEKWLNEMSAKGMQLEGVIVFRYTFTEGQAGEYVYRLALLEDLPSSDKGTEYIRFLEDTGTEYIGSCMRWVYFRKKAAEGAFDLYSDINSLIKQNTRILALLGVAGTMLLVSMCFLLMGHSLSGYQNGVHIGYLIVTGAFGFMLLNGIFNLVRRRRQLKKEQKVRE